jgi:hypothetical protein
VSLSYSPTCPLLIRPCACFVCPRVLFIHVPFLFVHSVSCLPMCHFLVRPRVDFLFVHVSFHGSSTCPFPVYPFVFPCSPTYLSCWYLSCWPTCIIPLLGHMAFPNWSMCRTRVHFWMLHMPYHTCPHHTEPFRYITPKDTAGLFHK